MIQFFASGDLESSSCFTRGVSFRFNCPFFNSLKLHVAIFVLLQLAVVGIQDNFSYHYTVSLPPFPPPCTAGWSNEGLFCKSKTKNSLLLARTSACKLKVSVSKNHRVLQRIFYNSNCPEHYSQSLFPNFTPFWLVLKLRRNFPLCTVKKM